MQNRNKQFCNRCSKNVYNIYTIFNESSKFILQVKLFENGFQFDFFSTEEQTKILRKSKRLFSKQLLRENGISYVGARRYSYVYTRATL